MNQTDQKKILDAGFTILRRQDNPKPIIKIKTSVKPYSWLKGEEFETKSARDRAMNELLKRDKCVED
ncbi:hypothetical protein [Dysgonomonas capnocytophagoides]|uniref:hypothetical protein n=1 Tax=Dysgonomonas capnocytophagoides TaxID=45254 RepID=UPI00333E5BB8